MYYQSISNTGKEVRKRESVKLKGVSTAPTTVKNNSAVI